MLFAKKFIAFFTCRICGSHKINNNIFGDWWNSIAPIACQTDVWHRINSDSDFIKKSGDFRSNFAKRKKCFAFSRVFTSRESLSTFFAKITGSHKINNNIFGDWWNSIPAVESARGEKKFLLLTRWNSLTDGKVRMRKDWLAGELFRFASFVSECSRGFSFSQP